MLPRVLYNSFSMYTSWDEGIGPPLALLTHDDYNDNEDDVFVIVCDGSKCRHVYDKRTNKLHSLVILLQDWAIVHVPLGHAASFVSYSN
jgi:hypothetical protein